MFPFGLPTGLRLGRSVAGLLLAVGLLMGPGAAQAAPGTDTAVPSLPPPATWAVTLNRTTLYSGTGEDHLVFGDVDPQVTLQVLGYQGDWAHIYIPRTRTEAYVHSDQLAPGDAPSRYVIMPPPALSDQFDTRGVVTDDAPLAVYPTPADEATERQLNPNTWLTLTGAVNGEDGSLWYRTDTGDFVPSDAVFVPERTADFTGHWLDVDLNTPARVTAYEGDAVANSFLTIKGA